MVTVWGNTWNYSLQYVNFFLNYTVIYLYLSYSYIQAKLSSKSDTYWGLYTVNPFSLKKKVKLAIQ